MKREIRDKETCLRYVEGYIDELNDTLVQFLKKATFLKNDNVIIMDELMLLNIEHIRKWAWESDITVREGELLIEGDSVSYLEFKNAKDTVLFKMKWPFKEIEDVAH